MTITYNDYPLTIPEFLRRKPKRGRPRKVKKAEVVSTENKWNEWDKTKREKYGTR